MKKNGLVAVFFSTLFLCAGTSAEKITVAGLRYRINPTDKTASVIRDETLFFHGKINIPDVVEHEGTSYHVTSIENGAFRGFTKITGVRLPKSLVMIGDSAFMGCENLGEVQYPSEVKLGKFVFKGCKRFIEQQFPDNWDGEKKNIHLPIVAKQSSIEVDYILYSLNDACKTAVVAQNNLFDRESNMSGTLFIPPTIEYNGVQYTVTSILYGAFQNFKKIDTLIVAEGISSIGHCAFLNCDNLISVTLPASLTSIGYMGFQGCMNIEQIIVSKEATKPIVCSHDVFFKVPIKACKLHLPEEVMNMYKNAESWKDFIHVSY